jgi:cytoskeleton protein RodZ
MSEGSAAPAGEASAGALLRQAREAAGLHVAALAVSLKVPVRKLEALEEDRYDLLPDAVFARALASSVCRTLKIDAQPVLERLPRSAAPRLFQRAEGINTPFRAPGEGSTPAWKEQLTRPVALAVIALLVGAGILVLLPEWQDDVPRAASRAEPVMPPGATASMSVAPADPPVPESAAAPAGAATPVTAASGSTAEPAPGLPAQAAPAVPAAVSAASATPAAMVAPVAAASAAASPMATAAAASGPAANLVVFKTKAPSWVEVMDAKGHIVMRRLMESGEAASVTGPLPLSVTIGSAGATEVVVRGRPFDLGPVSRDNVARFEVK